jgi:uncharacterized 2Fe-2S/4Fe-4S cluster protein (DUF4445 family)
MKKYTVNFEPDDKSIEVKVGTSVLDASISAGIPINSICGGEGTCGKCKILVKSDTINFEIKDTKVLKDEYKNNGYHLACQTLVKGNLFVEVPEVSRALDKNSQILEKTDCNKLEHIKAWCKSFDLNLTHPSIDNNFSDWQRLYFALKKYETETRISIPMELLQKLPNIIRDADWRPKVTIIELGDRKEVIKINKYSNENFDYGLAIDIGTTTIVVELVDLRDGCVIDTTSEYNKQILRGEDILSRVIFCEENENGLEEMNRLVIETINYLIDQLIEKNKIDQNDIVQTIVAGNTTMIHLLFKITPWFLRREPYIPATTYLEPLKTKTLGLRCNPNGYIFTIPGRASYVGGDVTADIIATGLSNSEDLSLLIDVGTNGEIVLGNRDFLIACSCSAGPAFEGGEVEHGMNATSGAIEAIKLDNTLHVTYSTINKTKPKGICGSGLIDLLSEMFNYGVIDKAGKIQDLRTKKVRSDDGCKEFLVVESKDTVMGKDITISEVDIQNILRTKAALYASCRLLVNTMGYDFNDIDNIYIAGGFGNYIDTKKAIQIGLLPDVSVNKFKFVGNGAVAGARFVLLSQKKYEEAKKIVQNMTYIDLSTNNNFFNEFTAALFLPHTNIDLFPSVKDLVSIGDEKI